MQVFLMIHFVFIRWISIFLTQHDRTHVHKSQISRFPFLFKWDFYLVCDIYLKFQFSSTLRWRQLSLFSQNKHKVLSFFVNVANVAWYPHAMYAQWLLKLFFTHYPDGTSTWLSLSAATFQRQIKHFNLTEIICPSESAGCLLCCCTEK